MALYLSSAPFQPVPAPSTHSPSLEQGTFLPLSTTPPFCHACPCRWTMPVVCPPPPRWNLSLNSVIFLAATSLFQPSGDFSCLPRLSATCLCYSSTERTKNATLEDFKQRIYRVPLAFALERLFSTRFLFSSRVSMLFPTEGYTIFAAWFLFTCKFHFKLFGFEISKQGFSRRIPEKLLRLIQINLWTWKEKKGEKE